MYNNNTYGFNPYMNQQRFQNQPLNQQPIQQTLPQIPQVCSLWANIQVVEEVGLQNRYT